MKRLILPISLLACAVAVTGAELQVHPTGGSQVQLAWQTSSNQSQKLLVSSNLQSWQLVMRPYPASAVNGLATNVHPATSARGFFRLQYAALTNSAVPTAPGMYSQLKLVSGGLTRTYRLFIPQSYPPTNNLCSLVVMLHGGGQSGDEFATQHPDLFTIANTNNMIVVLPDATPRDNTTSWMVNPPRPYEAAIDDTQFILDLINVLKCALLIDNHRVYAAGFSNGGQMVHQLGIKTTNTFAALAAVGSTIASAQDTNPVVLPGPSLEPYPVLIVNASNDCVRPYYGGLNVDGSWQSPAQAAGIYWVTNNGCSLANVTYSISTLATNYNRIFRFETDCYAPPVTNANALVTNAVVVARFAGCGTNAVVNFISLTDGGHIWPDADDNVGFDANAAVLAFFQQHARATYVAPQWNGQYEALVTSPIQNSNAFQAQITLRNPGDGIIPCGFLRWFNPHKLKFTTWTTPAGSTVSTNADGDLTWNFDRFPGHSALTLTVSGNAGTPFNSGMESSNITSSVYVVCGGGGLETNIVITVLSPLDYGDAPASYGTYYTNNGARHYAGALRLGAAVDVESDGLASANARGDDTGNLDDEDGVFFLNAPQAGTNLGLAIFASAGGYVDGWVDYNRDGSWTNGNEQILASLPVHAGSNYVSCLVSPFASPGSTFWRFRLSSTGGLAPTGFAANGEVEDYGTNILASSGSGSGTGSGVPPRFADWGDAPAMYPVLAADYGASHKLSDAICLGASIDGETNGIPHPNALGDDLANTDDGDGVGIPIITRHPSLVVTQSVQVSVTGEGYLNAWIDFNADGDWNDAGEQIAISHYLHYSMNPATVAFPVPTNAVLGSTYARFRFSVDAALPPSGPGNEGEVEDYKLTISPP